MSVIIWYSAYKKQAEVELAISLEPPITDFKNNFLHETSA